MKGITGFRLRGATPKRRDALASRLPAAEFDQGAQDRVMEKIKALGQDFYAMSEDQYGDWLDALPRDEFIELITAVIKLDEQSHRAAA
ncbi:hypothetical protein [Ralstonia pseudosolanacearum]|uniref:hypothetical protein n=1 Tax=Ralstonia pseudosolanacearum TaxID=1310165 RepID=UPI003CFA601B